MKRWLVTTLAGIVALAAPALADDEASEARSGGREETLAILSGLPDGWEGAEFSAQVEDGNGGAYRVGDPISFQLGTARPSHALLYYLDAYGVGTVFFVEGEGPDGALRAGDEATIPGRGDGFELRVVPPVGRETLVFVATRERITPEDLGLPEGTTASDPLDPDRATAVAKRLADAASRVGPDGTAVVHLEQRIVGGTDEIEYTTREIVQHFQATRALSRPRLPMHLPFEFDSAEINDEVRENLDQMGEALKHPSLQGRKLNVAGHTDDLGDPDYNLELSRKRAENVARYLEREHGISPEQLHVEAYGEVAPLEAPVDDAARAANRRVDFELRR